MAAVRCWSLPFENLVIRTGNGSLTVKGIVASGEHLQFEGGDVATVFDENWNKLRDLLVERKEYVMPTGWAPVSFNAESKAKPWLEVQLMTEGETMIVPAR